MPSDTATFTNSVLPPNSSVANQLTWPEADTVKPAGPLTKLNTSGCLGKSTSVAVKDNAKVLPSSRVCLATVAICGATFTSLIATWNSAPTVWMPSDTATFTNSVLPPNSSVANQLTWPEADTVKPAGPLTKLNTSGCLGKSTSVAVKDNVTVLPSSRVCLATVAICGATFTSFTTTVKRLVTESVPSETATLTTLVPGPWTSPGVQERTPAGFTVRPLGPPTSENTRVEPSGSTAFRLKLNGLPSSMAALAITSKTGSLLGRMKANKLVTGLRQ